MNAYEQRFVRAFGADRLVVTFADRDHETGDWQEWKSDFAAGEVVNKVLQMSSRRWRRHRWNPRTEEWVSLTPFRQQCEGLPRTFKALREMLLDVGDCAVLVETPAERERRVMEEERKELEAEASEIARKHNVEVNSPEFIEACYRELERFEEYRYEMKEDGLCIGWGVTPDQWFDEYNASQGDTAHVHRILDWVRKYLPLLWARWEQDHSDDSR